MNVVLSDPYVLYEIATILKDPKVLYNCLIIFRKLRDHIKKMDLQEDIYYIVSKDYSHDSPEEYDDCPLLCLKIKLGKMEYTLLPSGIKHGVENTWSFIMRYIFKMKIYDRGNLLFETKYHSNGRIGLISQYKNNVLHGKLFRCTRSGKLYSYISYIDGRKHGEMYEYNHLGEIDSYCIYEKGHLVYKMRYYPSYIEYKNNIINGHEYTSKYLNGNLFKLLTIYSQPHRKYYEWYENGQLNKYVEFTQGIINGYLFEWDQNGNLTLFRYYENGILKRQRVY